MQSDNLQDQLHKDIILGELNRIKLFVGTLFIGLLVMGFSFFVLKVGGFFNNPFATKFIMIWIFTFMLYESSMLFVVRWHIRNHRSQSIIIKVVNIIVEALFPGFLLFMLCLIESTPAFLDSPLFLIYFILIVLSALHLDVKLAILTSLLSALSYLAVTIWAINTFDPDFDTMHLHPFLYQIRSAFILTAGLCAVFVTNEIKKRIIRVSELWQQKTEIEGLFSQQVSPQVVEALVQNKHHSGKTKVTVLFLDVRDFTAITERMDPQEVVGFQNDLFCPLIEIINNHGGIVNQIMGDGFMATFGAPVKDPDHTLQAVNSGLEMLDSIKEMVNQGTILPTKVGIGVHTGEVITGNIGNEIRKQYSVNGTAVIIAARLEQLNKKLSTSFLISREVYQKVMDKGFDFTNFKEIKLKGINKPVEVYQVSRAK